MIITDKMYKSWHDRTAYFCIIPHVYINPI